MPSALLWASSAEEYFYFGVLKSLRAFQNPFFTGREPLSGAPAPDSPPFVTYGDIFPRSGGSLSSQGEPSRKVHR